MLNAVRPATVALAAALGIVLGAVLGFVVEPDGETRATVRSGPPPVTTDRPGETPPVQSLPPVGSQAPEPLDQERLRAALERGARAGAARGGTVEAALWAPGWRAPVISGDAGRRFRMWSLAKPVTALWTRLSYARTGHEPPAEVVDAMRHAIQRSENCAQRRVVLEVQRLAGGVERAHADLRAFLRTLGVHARTNSLNVPATPECQPYLQAHGRELDDPLGPALQLGTWEWTIRDAITFAAQLWSVRQSPAGAAVLRDMRRVKRANDEANPPLVVDPRFGAGKVFERATYKAGWGGQETGQYVVSQYGIDSRTGVAYAVAFHPQQQPPTADPGLTAADEALQAVLRPVARALEHP